MMMETRSSMRFLTVAMISTSSPMPISAATIPDLFGKVLQCTGIFAHRLHSRDPRLLDVGSRRLHAIRHGGHCLAEGVALHEIERAIDRGGGIHRRCAERIAGVR